MAGLGFTFRDSDFGAKKALKGFSCRTLLACFFCCWGAGGLRASRLSSTSIFGFAIFGSSFFAAKKDQDCFGCFAAGFAAIWSFFNFASCSAALFLASAAASFSKYARWTERVASFSAVAFATAMASASTLAFALSAATASAFSRSARSLSILLRRSASFSARSV